MALAKCSLSSLSILITTLIGMGTNCMETENSTDNNTAICYNGIHVLYCVTWWGWSIALCVYYKYVYKYVNISEI